MSTNGPPTALSSTTSDRQAASTSADSAISRGAVATSQPAANSTGSASKVHLVKAGAGGFKFEPARLDNVAVGDVVTFEFYPPDHSVARAEFGSACVPYEYTGRDKVGFWSGTQWVDSVSNVRQRRTFSIVVDSSETSRSLIGTLPSTRRSRSSSTALRQTLAAAS